MTELLLAMHEFFAQLGIPVYLENGIPTDAAFPYLSWSPALWDWTRGGLITVRIWDRAFSYTRLCELADRFWELVPDTIPTETGYIALAKGDPWAQIQPLQDTVVKAVYFNLETKTFLGG